MNSLRSRVLLAVLSAVIVFWIGAIAFVATYIHHSHRTVWDGKLQTIGTNLLTTLPRGADLPASGSGNQLRTDPLALSEGLVFQIWVDQRRLAVRTPEAPQAALQPSFENGLTTTLVDQRRWRVFTVTDSSARVQVQVAAQQEIVERELKNDALLLLGAVTVAVLFVGAVMWLSLRQSLSGIGRLERDVLRRAAHDMTPLPGHQLPTELQPLIAAFNGMLRRVEDAVEVERRFIQDAAHELRTPLAALQAHAQVGLAASTTTDKNTAFAKLLATAQRSSRLSEQLLDLAKLDAAESRPRRTTSDLSVLAAHVVREFDVPGLHQGKTIRTSMEPCFVDCDVDEVGTLLRNLLDNALRYSGPSGSIEVQTYTQENMSVLVVQDDGPGVPASERDAIFSRFHRVPGAGGRGSGIGLSLVSGIARLHKATISTGSGLNGRGLRIQVSFPASSSLAPTTHSPY